MTGAEPEVPDERLFQESGSNDDDLGRKQRRWKEGGIFETYFRADIFKYLLMDWMWEVRGKKKSQVRLSIQHSALLTKGTDE